jgi:hypothetical protein
MFGHAFGRWPPMIALRTEIILGKPAINKQERIEVAADYSIVPC